MGIVYATPENVPVAHRRLQDSILKSFQISYVSNIKNHVLAEEEECQFDIPVSEMLAIQVRIVRCDKKNNIISHIGK